MGQSQNIYLQNQNFEQMENKKVKKEKKGFWSLLKESVDKSSSGCGPGCGCHTETKENEKPKNKEEITIKTKNHE